MGERHDFNAATKTLIAGRAGYRCSIPGCCRVTIGPGSEANEVASTGVASHIFSASAGGPRGFGSLSGYELESGRQKVRELLGRGSFTTVQKHLAEWEASQLKLAAAEAERKKAGPPEELLSELQKVIGEFWPHAVARAKEEMRPEFQALEGKLLEAGQREKEATLEIGNLENSLEAALVKAARVETSEKKAAEAFPFKKS
jgi:hypothetical protein